MDTFGPKDFAIPEVPEIDTDQMFLTSTVENDQVNDLYIVDSIIAEEIQEDGSVKYLVKWNGYPMAECTLEIHDNVDMNGILDEWKETKHEKGRDFDAYCASNIALWESEREKFLARKSQIKQSKGTKRTKKQRQLATESRLPTAKTRARLTRTIPSDSDASEDDIPLLRRRSLPRLQQQQISANQSPAPGLEAQKPWSGPFDQSSPSSSDTEHSHRQPRSVASNDSLMEELKLEGSGLERARQVRNTERNPRKAKDHHHEGKQPANSKSIVEANVRDGVLSKAQILNSDCAKVSISSETTVTPEDNVPALPAAPKPLRSKEQATSIHDQRRQSTSSGTKMPCGPIRLINEPKLAKRSGTKEEVFTAKRVSTGSGELYTSLSIKRAAELRGRQEATPDPSALQFLGAPTALDIPRPAIITQGLDDNPYGRREIGHRRVESYSSDGDTHEPPDVSANTQNMSFIDGPIAPKSRKPPVTCFYWMTMRGGCDRSDDQCSFAHENTGLLGIPGEHSVSIDPQEPPASDRRPVCKFWQQGGKCRFAADKCKFRHYNISNTAEPPPRVKRINKSRSVQDDAPIPDNPSATWFNSPVEIEDHHNPEFLHLQVPVVPDPPPNGNEGTLVDQQLLSGSHMVAAPAQTEICQAPPPDYLSSEINERVERAYNLDFNTIFSFNSSNSRNRDGSRLMDRFAFLAFHPSDHAEDLELLTRWLLLHHVEAYNFWQEGSWDSFKHKVLEGGSGVLLAHPDFLEWWKVPDFGMVLTTKVRVYSVGYQYRGGLQSGMLEYGQKLEYDCIEIFPHGGFVYVTDEVFDQHSNAAEKIMSLYCQKISKCGELGGPVDESKGFTDGCLVWRLALRPDLMENLMKWCEAHEEQLASGEPGGQAIARIYSRLVACDYIRQRDDDNPVAGRPFDYFPILSEKGSLFPKYYERLARSQEEANRGQIRFYVEMLIHLRRQYRQFYVVHPRPSEVDWQSQFQNISGILTPDEFIECLEQDDFEGMRIDFLHWALPPKVGDVDNAAENDADT